MEKLNINDYKVIVFEDGDIVFKAPNTKTSHGDYLREYVDKKIEDNEYNNNLLSQIKRVDALDYMVDNIILITNSQVVLNTGYGFFVVLGKNITKEEIENLKKNSYLFENAESIMFERAFIEDNIASDEMIILDDFTQSLPFEEQLDAVYEIIQEKNNEKGRTK